MQTAIVHTHLAARAGSRSLAPRIDRLGSRSEQQIVINAPIEEVIAGFEMDADKHDRSNCVQTAMTDPTYRCTDSVLGRQVGVRYRFYAVPGGTQVIATVERASSVPVYPRFDRALRRERRRVASALVSVKDRLE
jgi:hypothetical protein